MQSDIKDEWVIGEGQHEGHRLLVRQNIGARPLIGSTRYSFRVGIAIPSISPQKDGMPGAAEIVTYERIEDLICDYFAANHTGVLCLVLTTQGMREFIIYSTTNEVTDLVGSLSHHFPQYDIQYYVEQDTDWEAYQQWDV